MGNFWVIVFNIFKYIIYCWSAKLNFQLPLLQSSVPLISIHFTVVLLNTSFTSFVKLVIHSCFKIL